MDGSLEGNGLCVRPFLKPPVPKRRVIASFDRGFIGHAVPPDIVELLHNSAMLHFFQLHEALSRDTITDED
jgi:hypothetical protein